MEEGYENVIIEDGVVLFGGQCEQEYFINLFREDVVVRRLGKIVMFLLLQIKEFRRVMLIR